MVLNIFFLLVLFSRVVIAAAAVQPLANLSDCKRKCGNITVPYPFGLSEAKCSKDSSFSLTCDNNFAPPKLLLNNFTMLDMSLENATALIEVNISFTCYGMNGMASKFSQNATMEDTPFVFSTRNKFTAIGCDTIASIGDGNLDRFTTGCISVCSSNNIRRHTDPYNFAEELISCGGIGCCQTSVPKELKTLYITLDSFSNHSSQLVTNPCSFGFLSYPTWYRDVSKFTLADPSDKHTSSPVVLDWAIRGFTCEEAKGRGDKNGYICGPHTNCIDTPNSPGYLCSCENGYNGNPYTKTGCQDVDECNDVQKYPCNGKCKNTIGNYTCTCPFGHQGDGKLGCNLSTGSKTAIGIGAVVSFANFLLFLYWLHKKKIHQLNHRKNGGFLLDQLSVKSFKEAQIVKATNNFDSKNLLGEGGNGWVYRGLTEDGLEIAVKKSKVVDQNQIEQFLNEADIVSKINHKNVVKLLGLCVDSKVPMLVYDYVPNGTLYQHIHGKNSGLFDSWRMCLRIATETARALDYMHSLAYPPIIHRDIKTSNILLDETYTAKVADFGASILIPLDRTMAPTQGQGTMGYLDPEYLQTGELTTMSDVYGFGVILMELLSKQKPITRGQSGEMIGLVKIFTAAVENNHFEEVVKVAGVTENENGQVYLFANLAIRCVAMPSKKRPTMTEVADVLNGISKVHKNFPLEGNGDEFANLLDEQEITTNIHGL